MTKEEIVRKFRLSTLQQESSGNYHTPVNDSGCGGGYGFCQGTWDSAARSAGYEQYVGVSSEQAPPEVQDAVAEHEMLRLYDKYNGDLRYVANAWYAGEGAADSHYANGSLPENDENGYPSQSQYANEVIGRMGNPIKEGVADSISPHFDYMHGEQKDPVIEHPDLPQPSWWDKFSTNFMDAMTNTGTASFLQELWGTMFHSNNKLGMKDDLTQEDMDKVKAMLPNDPDAQRFVLLNARDSENLDWLINQKLVDKKRREDIERFRDGIEFKLMSPDTWRNFGWSEVGQVAGELFDPVNLIPMGEVAKLGTAAKILGRVGKNVTRMERVMQYADIGAKNALVQTADNYARDKFGGQNKTLQDYGWGAASAFVAGAVLGKIGDSFSNFKLKKGVSEKISNAAEGAEDYAIKQAADIIPDNVLSETLEKAKALHDVEFGKTLGSKIYNTLEEKGRVVSMSLKDASKLVYEHSGMMIDEKTKAFYVPNEDYAVIIKDNVKSKEDIDSLLGHEFAVHAGLQKALGEQEYGKLMRKVQAEAKKEGSIWFEASKKTDSYDPEEILAYAVENDMLSGGVLTFLKNSFNRAFKKEGYDINFTKEHVKELMRQELDSSREARLGIHRNPDGSTAFAGLRYSKENILNPDWYSMIYQLEQPVIDATQKDIGTSLVGRVFQQPLQWLGRHLDRMTPFGRMATSSSNTIRSYAGRMLDDARSRAKSLTTLPADSQKMAILNQLMSPYIDYVNTRASWVASKRMLPGRKSFAEFDRAVTLAYNEKYGNHVGVRVGEVDKEIAEAVEHIHRYREEQIRIGKDSARMFGLKNKNLIDKDWKEVDFELWRTTTNELRHKFIFENFKGNAGSAAEFLDEYYRSAAKRDVIAQKIIRRKEQENIKIKERNKKAEKHNKEHPEDQQELEKEHDVVASEGEIEEYLDEHVPVAVKHMLHSDFDSMSVGNRGKLGHLSFLKERVPIDTSIVVKMPNGSDFSFDNNLRNFDMDTLIQRNANRFAGEIAVKNTFGTSEYLTRALDKAKKELQYAVENGTMNRKVAESEFKNFEDTVNELRGFRPDADTIGRAGAIMRILQNLSYAKNGANMGLNQLGEVSGTIAYGGAKQLFNILPSLGRMYEDAHLGKITAQTLRDAEAEIFGETIERQIWTMNFGDRVIRNALTKKNSLINGLLVNTGDAVYNLGKLTSSINMLPKMTDSMVRGMRRQTMTDSLRWANGETFSKLRNPFSESKLQASGINSKMADKIKKGLKKYTKVDKAGNLESFDWQTFRQNEPMAFHAWYDLVQKQAERAIVSGTRLGNKNILKDGSQFMKLIFQFKDYNLRAINSQTMRAMTTGELDDAMAAMLSMATNTAVYIARAGMTYQTMKALGMTEKAEEYWDKNCKPEQLAMVAAIRSTMVGSPLSTGNDVYEAISGKQTMRTTVDRQNVTSPKNRDASDVIGDFFTQLPAAREAIRPIEAYQAFNNMSEDRANKRDFKNLLGLLPLPNLIPIAQYLNYVTEQSGYPDKRPKNVK